MNKSSNSIMACPQASQGAGLSATSRWQNTRPAGFSLLSLTQRFGLPTLVRVHANYIASVRPLINRNVLFVFLLLTSLFSQAQPSAKTDAQAENMLIYQRAIGGWPKAVNEVKVDYAKTLTLDQAQIIKNDSLHKDATIDNKATTREIEYLITAYKKTGNQAYKAAAERGIRYLLKAQYANGGWPQYYPDASLYRHQITFNDDAMIHVLDLLQDLVEGKHDFDVVDVSLKTPCETAIQKGIDCIVKTQVKQAGQLTAWAAQYDEKTFEPAKARAFELPSIASSESVGIIRFLMRQKNPSPAIKQAITAAVLWLDKVKIVGYNFVAQPDASQPKGFDKKFLKDANSTVWARFYELGTDKPLFVGRDSQKKYAVSEIESERRNGYAWYGTWPQKLIDEQYPKWKKATGN